MGIAPLSTQALTMDFVPVGNPGNTADPQNSIVFPGAGAVAYPYAIGKYEVTNAQYTEFLNRIDPTGGNSLALYNPGMSSNLLGGINFITGGANGSKYSAKTGYDNLPVVYVSFFDAVRFTNWLNNGQGVGSTEAGAYTLLGGTPTPSNGNTFTRNPTAQVWVPSDNEWYKAAYHQPFVQGGDSDNFWLYPMQTNSVPFSDQPPGATPDNTRASNFFKNDNTANGFDDGYATTGSASLDDSQNNYLTNVGAYTQSDSFYGTFDQGGNVLEWEDTITSGSNRAVRGGSWFSPEDIMRSGLQFNPSPTMEDSNLGFRVATVPESGGLALLSPGTMLLLSRGKGRAGAGSRMQ